MSKTLANKYRPKSFEDVVEQDDIKTILTNQIKNNDIRNAYLFVGGAGTGKTTCARIFAKEINDGLDCAIEIDGASNNGVEQVRAIGEQARTTSMVSKHKVFIIDECHMITIQGWNAMLKLIEEPPLNTIFIFCTTNPEKIPKTIMSRVQRYDFGRISTKGIVVNLVHILTEEKVKEFDTGAVEYIAKLADGHMRDAITMLDKCLAYGTLTYDTVTKSLGLNYHEDLKELMLSATNCEDNKIIELIENVYASGISMTEFMRDALIFALDYSKWRITQTMDYCSCPMFCEDWFKNECNVSSDILSLYIKSVLKIIDTIKYDPKPKTTIEAMLLLESNYIRGLANE